jgi:hypothetical protein
MKDRKILIMESHNGYFLITTERYCFFRNSDYNSFMMSYMTLEGYIQITLDMNKLYAMPYLNKLGGKNGV